jgi:hypothetical protein
MTDDARRGYLERNRELYLETPQTRVATNNVYRSWTDYFGLVDETAGDVDGDKAFLVWEGKDGAGTFKWTCGTGTFSGLQGNNTFHYTSIDRTAAGIVLWEGDWRLP